MGAEGSLPRGVWRQRKGLRYEDPVTFGQSDQTK